MSKKYTEIHHNKKIIINENILIIRYTFSIDTNDDKIASSILPPSKVRIGKRLSPPRINDEAMKNSVASLRRPICIE